MSKTSKKQDREQTEIKAKFCWKSAYWPQKWPRGRVL